MSLTVRIVWQYILSRVRVSVRPSIFLYAKNINKLPRKPTFAYLTVEWTSGAAGHTALSDGHGWMASDSSLCRYNCGNTYPDRLTKTAKINKSKTGTIRVYTFTALTMWFRNYYVAYAFVVCVCVKINNEELFFNAFLFWKFILFFVLDRLIDAVRSTGNLSSHNKAYCTNSWQ